MASVKKYNFDGKVALVTGSSSGIGAAIATQLAQYGARVTITGRNVEALVQVASKIEKISGQKPLQVIGDLANESDLPLKLITDTLNKFGQLDILVNNAGWLAPNDTLHADTVMDNYDRVFRLNVRSALNLVRLAVPHLEKTKGNIINISNGYFVYSMSKAALDMLTKTAAQELGPKGIRVNSVNPGDIITNIHRSRGVEGTQVVIDEMKKYNLLDMAAEPVEIANLVSFLASSDAANITGSIMLSDTGALVKKH